MGGRREGGIVGYASRREGGKGLRLPTRGITHLGGLGGRREEGLFGNQARWRL